MSQMTRPEEGERGLGASHRRGGMGVASYRRPPEGLVKALGRVESPTSKAPGVKRKVESMRDKGAKRTADRKLHIDDGCMGGGEGNIEYVDKIFYDANENIGRGSIPKQIPGSNNDFYDYKFDSNYFSSSRKGVFHYAIICYDYYREERDGSVVYPVGTSENPGNDLIISHSDVPSGSTNMARVFMHELGHNFGLNHAPGDSTTVMSIINYNHIDDSSVVDYSSTEWPTLNYCAVRSNPD